jgi:predicted dehydrogenase
VAQEYETQVFDSLDALADAATAVSVAVPTADHARVGCELLRRGLDVLVEKPIASSLAEADQLIETARQGQRILHVGHTERFNPAVTAAAQVVTQPLFFEVHRLGVFSGRSLDVDVIFDLMIHDLDILLSLVPAEVEQVHAVGIPILSPKVDIANVRLEFANGCVANLTASRASMDKVRKMRFFQPHAYISIDFGRRDVLMIDIGDDVSPDGLGPGLPAGLQLRKLETQPEEPLHAELRTFVDALHTRRPGPANGPEARRALELAERVATGIAEHATKLPAEALPGETKPEQAG